MWSYPVQTVYDYYMAAVQDTKRETYSQAQIMRLTGLSAREHTKKGSQTMNKAWEGLLKSLEPDKRKRTAQTVNSKSHQSNKPEVVAQNQTAGARQAANAASVFLAAGDFTPVKLDKGK